jgi:hypothetical protein
VAAPIDLSLHSQSSLSSQMGLLLPSSRRSSAAARLPHLRNPLQHELRLRGVSKASGVQLPSTERRGLVLEHVVGLESHRLTSATSFAAKLEAAHPSNFMA